MAANEFYQKISSDTEGDERILEKVILEKAKEV
jgi:hypothetical protein